MLTVTSGAGTLRPRGAFSADLSDPINITLRTSFDTRLRLSDDPQAFTARITEIAPLIDCIQVFRIALVRSG
jgi:hypothetical protein